MQKWQLRYQFQMLGQTEQGATALKHVKTKQRNRLGNRMLEPILQVCINGPLADSIDGQSIVKQAVQMWVT